MNNGLNLTKSLNRSRFLNSYGFGNHQSAKNGKKRANKTPANLLPGIALDEVLPEDTENKKNPGVEEESVRYELVHRDCF